MNARQYAGLRGPVNEILLNLCIMKNEGIIELDGIDDREIIEIVSNPVDENLISKLRRITKKASEEIVDKYSEAIDAHIKGEIYIAVDSADGGEYNPLHFIHLASAAVYGFKFAEEAEKAEFYSKKWEELLVDDSEMSER